MITRDAVETGIRNVHGKTTKTIWRRLGCISRYKRNNVYNINKNSRAQKVLKHLERKVLKHYERKKKRLSTNGTKHW
jgi:hypothetical protein